MFTEAELRRLKVRTLARRFARGVRESNMAHSVPDEIIDELKQEEMASFFERLEQFGLVMRKDCLWERK